MKNIAHVAAAVARTTQVSAAEAESVLQCFFKRLEDTMNLAVHPYVRIEHLGLFMMKPQLINKQIRRHIAMLRQLPKTHWRQQTNQKIIEAVRARLVHLLDVRNEVATTIYTYRCQKQAGHRQGLV